MQEPATPTFIEHYWQYLLDGGVRLAPYPQQAHPCLCGEHITAFGTATERRGSSPLTRGALTVTTTAAHLNGLIPAHAGSTHALDHDRGGDEGSSPLTRGARLPTGGHDSPPRLIPAHAGSTITMTNEIATNRAHPRSRGEHLNNPNGVVAVQGSSPLTRGALDRYAIHRPGLRLIPAHAGSTGIEYAKS